VEYDVVASSDDWDCKEGSDPDSDMDMTVRWDNVVKRYEQNSANSSVRLVVQTYRGENTQVV